jgi:cytochrome c oxidase cbb3-type subunit I/II
MLPFGFISPHSLLWQMLHIGRILLNCLFPFSKVTSWYAGVQDALVQWWYGHNAVAFFLDDALFRLDVLFLT